MELFEKQDWSWRPAGPFGGVECEIRELTSDEFIALQTTRLVLSDRYENKEEEMRGIFCGNVRAIRGVTYRGEPVTPGQLWEHAPNSLVLQINTALIKASSLSREERGN